MINNSKLYYDLKTKNVSKKIYEEQKQHLLQKYFNGRSCFVPSRPGYIETLIYAAEKSNHYLSKTCQRFVCERKQLFMLNFRRMKIMIEAGHKKQYVQIYMSHKLERTFRIHLLSLLLCREPSLRYFFRVPMTLPEIYSLGEKWMQYCDSREYAYLTFSEFCYRHKLD